MIAPKRGFRPTVLTVLSVLSVCILSASHPRAAEPPLPVRLGKDGRLVYEVYERGDRVPDFSYCGCYAAGQGAIPVSPARVVVSPAEGAPAEGDDGARIQAAIDYVSQLKPDAQGLRGAVLLERGRYEVSGQLRIAVSGVVLRGSGMGEDGTVLVADGLDRRVLIRVTGKNDREIASDSSHRILDEYVPVGSCTIHVDSADRLKPGDTILVARAGTPQWVGAVGMSDMGGGRHGPAWHAENFAIVWDRVVASVKDTTVTLDAPLTTAIDAAYGGGTVQEYFWPGRIERVGIENLRLESVFDTANPKDEAHSWGGISMESVQNAWVRQVAFLHFAGSAVSICDTAKGVTVQDCKSLDPVSEIGGYRRHTFFTSGQLCLFLRCRSERGRHDFSVGRCAPGPNAFVACETLESLADSGPIESWASGVLYDNVRIDGAGLNLMNRWTEGAGAGWAAANCMIWQSTAAEMRVFNPPTARNWAIGVWANFIGDGVWGAGDDTVEPRSLFLGQLSERLGPEAAERMGPLVEYAPGTRRPTYEQAAQSAAVANAPSPQVLDLIDGAAKRDPIPVDASQAKTIEKIPHSSEYRVQPASSEYGVQPAPEGPGKRLCLNSGWLTIDGKIKTGGIIESPWWRGSISDFRRQAELALTRFVPCRTGRGYTDDLNEVADTMLASGVAVFDQHYPLWYDRRRDDHERVRRANGNVCPPFYEHPFARSGKGTAWDGLSKYDLTQYNSWYWSRLKEFAGLCDRKGLILFHENFFQHHILEAGAHWADCPWRTANNINDTGFPEPPPYANDKLIFQAHLFYDVKNPVRVPLYRAYIRQCLENFAANSNVVQLTSDEYTGPVEFVQFWMDTIMEWEKETGHDVLIGLSATKDVQDAILADPVRGPAVSVIDIKYWWYQSNGELYAPEGGKNLAPRQHERQLNPKPTSFEQTVRAVREYRMKFPEKAVVCRIPGADGWAVLMGGGSLPSISQSLDNALLTAIAKMRPLDGVVTGDRIWCLGEPGKNYLIYSATRSGAAFSLEGGSGSYSGRSVDPASGKMTNLPTGEATVAGSPIAWYSRR